MFKWDNEDDKKSYNDEISSQIANWSIDDKYMGNTLFEPDSRFDPNQQSSIKIDEQMLLDYQFFAKYSKYDKLVPYSTLSSPPPCKFGKILVVDNFVEKNYFENFRIRNYFKKDFLNFSFHYVRYCNHLVTFLEKISHQFALIFQALNEVSQSNIFLVFFC